MRPALGTARRVIGLLAGAALIACASRGIEVREYVLTAGVAPGAATGAGPVRIGVGPVVVPRYLQRKAIVTRIGANELRASDVHRWGEDLDRGLARVVAENLAVLVPGSRVETFPWREQMRMDDRVWIQVERFEPAPDGSVTLEARWEVRRTGQPARAGRTSTGEPSSGADPAAVAGAMSRAAARLSQEIAGAILADAAARGGPPPDGRGAPGAARREPSTD